MVLFTLFFLLFFYKKTFVSCPNNKSIIIISHFKNMSKLKFVSRVTFITNMRSFEQAINKLDSYSFEIFLLVYHFRTPTVFYNFSSKVTRMNFKIP